MRTIQAKARKIKAKLTGDGAIRIIEEPPPGCLATIADKLRPVVWFTAGFVAGIAVGIIGG